MIMLSRYTNANCPFTRDNTTFVVWWKVPWALRGPNGVQENWGSLCLEVEVAFLQPASSIFTCQYRSYIPKLRILMQLRLIYCTRPFYEWYRSRFLKQHISYIIYTIYKWAIFPYCKHRVGGTTFSVWSITFTSNTLLIFDFPNSWPFGPGWLGAQDMGFPVPRFICPRFGYAGLSNVALSHWFKFSYQFQETFTISLIFIVKLYFGLESCSIFL